MKGKTPFLLSAFLFSFCLLYQGCSAPPDVPRTSTSDPGAMMYPVKGVNSTPTQSVSNSTDDGGGSFTYSDNEVSPSELTSLHNRLHNLDGSKEPLDDESIQSTNPKHVKGQPEKPVKKNQQQNEQQNEQLNEQQNQLSN